MPAPGQLNTYAIVLRRINYGEADRIITLLTPDQGKISAIAKGARKAKSKLAGGIELFSISEISFIKGKNDIDTLTSTRLEKHFGQIVTDLTRSNAGYEFIKMVDKATEETPEADYYHLLAEAFGSLNELSINVELVRLWFSLRLLKIAGHAPDFFLDTDNNKLSSAKTYDFDYEQMRFANPHSRQGSFNAEHIKFLRLSASAERPHLMQRVNNAAALSNHTKGLVQSIISAYIPIK